MHWTGTELGRCPCGTAYELRYVDVRMTVDDAQIVLDAVEQGECEDCGRRVYREADLEALEAAMRARELPRAYARI